MSASIAHYNIYYEVLLKSNNFYSELLEQIRKAEGSGVIYCFNRNNVEDLIKRLQRDGVQAVPYHPGLNNQEKAANLNNFLQNRVQLIVAMSGFDKDIFKPDIRFIIHHDLPRGSLKIKI